MNEREVVRRSERKERDESSVSLILGLDHKLDGLQLDEGQDGLWGRPGRCDR